MYNNEKRLITIDEAPRYSTHVGQVIQSTKLDTAAKVQAIYGGTWRAWGVGRVPVGVDPNDSDFDTVGKTGGVKEVTLTIEQMPSHRHGWSGVNDGASVSSNLGKYPFRVYQDKNANWSGSEEYLWAAGGSKPHTNLQPYQTVYMWERTA